MDHVKLPRNPTRSLPSVPIYARQEYDGGPFLDYLDRIGWSEQELVGWFSPRTSDELHDVLQTWTYFGLLSTILGRRVSIAQFTKVSESDKGSGGLNEVSTLELTTKDLTPLVHEWVEREARLPRSKRLVDEEHMRLCMEKVWHIYDALGMDRSEHNALDSCFCLSVQVLCELLIATHKYAFHPPDLELLRFQDIKILLRSISYAADQLHSEMHASGWCPAEIDSIRKLSPSELCMAYCLDRPGPDKNHSECSSKKCLAYQISEDEYQTRHATTGCDCEYVHCSQAVVAEILLGDSGSIPLISHAEPIRGPEGKLWVTLLPSKARIKNRSWKQQQQHARFVAISHVWSDGLGNNRDNAIPLCQFRRLSALVTGLCSFDGRTESLPFWFDTLCFPLYPPEAGDTALIRMRESYEDADQVLVLDGYLLSADSEFMSDNELLVRIFLSPWNRRLWTLQEGVLPRRLIFRFANQYVPSRYFIEKFFKQIVPLQQGRHMTRSELANEPLPNMSYNALLSLRDRRELDAMFSPAIIKETLRLFPYHATRLLSLDLQHYWRLALFILQFIWVSLSGAYTRMGTAPMVLDQAKSALTYRTTSVKADEPLCLGNLLGVEPAAIVRAHGHEARMEIIWDFLFSQGNGHAMLLFAKGPRLRTPGYRWAPVSLMDSQPVEFWGGIDSSLQKAVKLPEGLLASMPAVLLQAEKVELGIKFEFRTSQRNGYLVRWGDLSTQNIADGEKEILSSNGFFVILTMAALEVEGTPSFHLGLRNTWLADLVSTNREEGYDRLRLISFVNIEKYSDNSAVVWTKDELDRNAGFRPFPGTIIPRAQWLID
ncbi:hypothetical protein F4782DRAFT_303906 [Xylaria castorea]|nr:hypothetical protein F4782DRAFT_303906 [Xylaria castorea]